MTDERVTISVLLLCWNHAAFLEQCISALAAQTDRHFQICFLDNASTDKSLEKAQALFERFGLKARVCHNPQGASIPANFNQLLAQSSGDIVAPLSTDDWYEPNYVACLRQAALSAPGAGWFSCSGWLFFDSEQRSQPFDEAQLVLDRPIQDVLLDGGQPYFFVGCAYRRSALDEVGGWDENQLLEDGDLFLRLSARHEHHRLGARLVHYRRSAQNISANPRFMVAGREKFWRKHGKRMPKDGKPFMASSYRSAAAIAVDLREYRLAASLIWRAVKIEPTNLMQYRTLLYLLRRVADWR